MEDANATARDDAFHVAAVLRAKIGAFEVADFLAMLSPDVGTAMRTVCGGFDLVNNGVSFTFEETGDTVVARLHAVFEDAPHPLEAEVTLLSIHTRIRATTAGEHGALSMRFAHPEGGSGAAIRGAVPGTVVFDAGETALVVSRACWEARATAGHPRLAALVGATVKATASPTARIRQALLAALREGDATVEGLSRRLSWSPRSLQRRLLAEGLSFRELAVEARRDLAIELLRGSTASVDKIAERLGFSQGSAFARAFRRWTGRSPSDYRLGDSDDGSSGP